MSTQPNLDPDCCRFANVLNSWIAFSLLQQRTFAFLAGEAKAFGQDFENSTEGATRVLTRINDLARFCDNSDIQSETWAVVHKLQAADRSRQGLEQVASVLSTLGTLHSDLVAASDSPAEMPTAEALTEKWIAALVANVSLADWRRRLDDALHGRQPSAAAEIGGDEELF
jgi:hypothetical protein